MISGDGLKRLCLWLLQITVFLLIPVFLVHAGLSHIDDLRYSDRLMATEQKIEKALASFATHANTEEFMARTFRHAYLEMLKGKPVAIIRDYHKRLAGGFDYLLWDSSNHLLDTTFTRQEADDWKNGLTTIRAAFSQRSRDFNPTDKEIASVRRLLGPQLVLSTLTDCLAESNRELMAHDSSGQRPLSWIASLKGLTLVILVKPEAVNNSDHGLHYYLNYLQPADSPFVLGFVRKNRITTNKELPDQSQAVEILQQHSLKNGLKLITPQAHYFMRILEEDLTLFAGASIESLSTGNSAALTAGLILLLLMPLLIFSGRAELRNQAIPLSISRKLLLLFIYSSGLPLAMLFFVGYDYLTQKQHAMFDDIHAQGTGFLKNFDERFKSEEALRIFRIKHALSDLKKLMKEGISVPSFRQFAGSLTKDIKDPRDVKFYMVASEADFIGTHDSIYSDGQRSAVAGELGREERKKKDEEAHAFTALIKFILSNLNGEPSDSKTAAEIEMLAESVMQKSLLEVQNEFLQSNNQIAHMGLGISRSLAYIELISLFTGGKYDYLLMTIWETGVLEDCYISRQFLNAGRNVPDLQLGIINEETGSYFPAELSKNNDLREYTRQFTHRPVSQRQFISLNHQDYLIMGFRGKFLKNFSLLALYPVSRIRDQIFHEKSRLITFGIVSLLLALILGQILSYSFLFPLRILAEGAEAIQQRNFSARLPELGRDEFGDMARVFNTTMVDLEELKVAGAVQEHLLPSKLPEFAGCQIYAQSLSLGDLGGDYYDCFTSNSGNLCLLTGDVSGHGVGAALIMAMAKAAIMKLEELHNAPADLLMRMHQLIATTRQDQVKSMAFQIFNIDMQTKKALYTNAGSWPPLLINAARQQATEISLPGPRLGTLKKPVFKTIDLEFSDGEALLLYTDGLIKAKDTRDRMIGLENFKKLAVQSFDLCPQKYFNNLMAAHRMMTGNRELQDDTTMIIVVFNKS